MKLRIFIIALLFSAVTTLCFGCSGSTSDESAQEEVAPTYLVTQSEAEITRLINYFKADYVELDNKITSGAVEDADAVHAEIEGLKSNLDKLDGELTNAVENNKISQDVKMGFDTTIESLKTDLDSLSSELGA